MIQGGPATTPTRAAVSRIAKPMLSVRNWCPKSTDFADATAKTVPAWPPRPGPVSEPFEVELGRLPDFALLAACRRVELEELPAPPELVGFLMPGTLTWGVPIPLAPRKLSVMVGSLHWSIGGGVA